MDESQPIRVVITPGDPAGIGPFVMYRAWQTLGAPGGVVFAGPQRLWSDVAARVGGTAPICLDTPGPELPIPVPGQPDRSGAIVAWRALDAAIDEARQSGAALVTGPISKKHMLSAGFPFAGHTEYLQQRFGAPDVLMVMAAEAFIVGLATVHVPLREVPGMMTRERVARAIRLLNAYLERCGVDSGRPLAVAGVNPHAGEQGALGDEEQEIIAAIEDVGADLSRAIIGPLPGDTVFRELAQGRVAAVLAMYHDQGLAPFKLLHFDRGVNVTVGLPVLRTSPDHGTAFDLAPRDCASSSSAEAALSMALKFGSRWSPPPSRTAER